MKGMKVVLDYLRVEKNRFIYYHTQKAEKKQYYCGTNYHQTKILLDSKHRFLYYE